MNRSGVPANCWLLCLIYVCYLLNHIACTALDGKLSLLALTGISPDISIILLFTFYQPVFYATYDQYFPSETEERAGYWVGFGEHCGDAMTHKILDHDTQKIIYRSAARPKKSSTPNHRLATHGGEVSASSDPSEDKISDMIYIKTQVFRLLRYYFPAPRKIARSVWATQNITHNMTSSLKQPYGVHSH